MTKDPANFREYAGTLIASIIVCAFVAIGFVAMAIVVVHGTPAQVPGDWMAAMLSLASAALGFLIGKQTTGTNSTTLVSSPPVVLQPNPPAPVPPPPPGD